jgi:hypothetical protein
VRGRGWRVPELHDQRREMLLCWRMRALGEPTSHGRGTTSHAPGTTSHAAGTGSHG